MKIRRDLIELEASSLDNQLVPANSTKVINTSVTIADIKNLIKELVRLQGKSNNSTSKKLFRRQLLKIERTVHIVSNHHIRCNHRRKFNPPVNSSCSSSSFTSQVAPKYITNSINQDVSEIINPVPMECQIHYKLLIAVGIQLLNEIYHASCDIVYG